MKNKAAARTTRHAGHFLKRHLSETHGHCMLQRFASKGGNARPSPHVTFRASAQLL